MTDIWFTSDQHFGHANILRFRDANGMLLRPEFSDVDEMNEVILENHNRLVKPNDTVYHLGDIVWKLTDQRILSQLHGKKRLTVGNHDRVMDIAWAFERIYLWRKFDVGGVKFIASHCPLNEDDMVRAQYSVHGHLHERSLLKADGGEDPRFLNVGVEKMGYYPVHIEEVVDLLKLYTVGEKELAVAAES
jgi:calcineurin-like phosphoesterase family protein